MQGHAPDRANQGGECVAHLRLVALCGVQSADSFNEMVSLTQILLYAYFLFAPAQDASQ